MKSSTDIRVLVVEDDALMRWAIAETLREAGCAVVGAADGAAAIRAIADSDRTPQAVVLDVGLPDSEGLDLLATIRRLIPSSHVILITAFGTPELAADARKLGAYDVLNKPFDLHVLQAVVEHAGAARP